MSADQDKIKALAYRLWQEGGCAHGRDMDYWLMAEAQLSKPAKPKAAKVAPAKPKAAKVAPAKPKAAKAASVKPKAPVKAKAPAKAKVAAKV